MMRSLETTQGQADNYGTLDDDIILESEPGPVLSSFVENAH